MLARVSVSELREGVSFAPPQETRNNMISGKHRMKMMKNTSKPYVSRVSVPELREGVSFAATTRESTRQKEQER